MKYLIEMRKEFDRLLNLDDPNGIKFPSAEELNLWQNGVIEEMKEAVDAFNDGNMIEFYDAIIDLLYFHLRMFTAADLPLDGIEDVHQANMQKRKAKNAAASKRNNECDAVKPEGWKPPELSNYVAGYVFSKPDTVKPFLPELFYNAAILANSKDKDYNKGVFTRDDYFVFGKKSYLHMLYTKVLRLISLSELENINHESEEDSCLDLVNYTSFYYDYLKSQEYGNEEV